MISAGVPLQVQRNSLSGTPQVHSTEKWGPGSGSRMGGLDPFCAGIGWCWSQGGGALVSCGQQ
uniref:Uncharacterized protein n=1 Tax=Anguilla anguilla TaxID=7936 RepID=A0A0E9WPE4_ANGAN